MAKTTQVIMIDDFDGGPAQNSVKFSLEGIEYEIDLNDANWEKMKAAFQPFIEAGKRISVRRRRNYSSPSLTREETRIIRKWALDNGIDISDRGRIPADIVAEYRKTQQ